MVVCCIHRRPAATPFYCVCTESHVWDSSGKSEIILSRSHHIYCVWLRLEYTELGESFLILHFGRNRKKQFVETRQKYFLIAMRGIIEPWFKIVKERRLIA